MKALDWYAGAGGYTLAMRRAGVEVVGACERDMAKRAAYVEACGIPAWFGEDCLDARNVPAADIWAACESNPRLVAWATKTVAEHRPTWVWCETVRQNEDTVWDALEAMGYRVSNGYAGARVHIIAGPSGVVIPELPAHRRELKEQSDAATLAIVLAALLGSANG